MAPAYSSVSPLSFCLADALVAIVVFDGIALVAEHSLDGSNVVGGLEVVLGIDLVIGLLIGAGRVGSRGPSSRSGSN
jgi:hypothetical protein